MSNEEHEQAKNVAGMNWQQKAQQGFAGTGVVIIVLVIVLVGAIGFAITQKHSTKSMSSGNSNSQTGSANLSGTVTQGPTGPICSDTTSCYGPVANHTIEAVDTSNNIAATTKTDSAGKYSFQLKPGHYVLKLVPQVGPSALSNNEVDVTSGSKELNLTVDSGIR